MYERCIGVIHIVNAEGHIRIHVWTQDRLLSV